MSAYLYEECLYNSFSHLVTLYGVIFQMHLPIVITNISHYSVGWWVTFEFLSIWIGLGPRYLNQMLKITVHFLSLLGLISALCAANSCSITPFPNPVGTSSGGRYETHSSGQVIPSPPDFGTPVPKYIYFRMSLG